MSVALGLYRATWSAALALGVPSWILRGRPDELAERLGRGPDLTPGSVWVHAASMGEMVAADALVRAFRRHGVGPVALTAMTRTGRTRGEALRPDVGPLHAPLDAPRAVSAFLDRLRPRALVALEMELWPNQLLELGRRSLPWAVASARVSDGAMSRLRPVRGLLSPLLAGARAIAAQTQRDAERLRWLGARPEALRVLGDLKSDREVPPWSAPPGDRPRWAAACTRPGEESDVLEALRLVSQQVPHGELLLAPRHPERFEEAARLVSREGWPLRRWSRRGEAATEDGWSVVLVDEMGMLDEVYRHVDCAFVGGSLRSFGGHSPLEAAAAGRAVLVGPHTEHCRHSVEHLDAAAALTCVRSAAELGERVAKLLTEPEESRRIGRAAREAALGLSGAADATVAFLREREVVR